MASTNKTDNLNLSQFADSDKPTWLSDYNEDMEKIDAGMSDISTALANKANPEDMKWKLWNTYAIAAAATSTARPLPDKFDELLICLTSNNAAAMGGVTITLQIPYLQLTDNLAPFIFGANQIVRALPDGLYGIYTYMRFSKTQFANGPARAKADGTTYMIDIANTISIYYR